jgi:hypothetical protein
VFFVYVLGEFFLYQLNHIEGTAILDIRSKFTISFFLLFFSLGLFLLFQRENIKNIYPVSSIYVKVQGNIKKPGLYELKDGQNLQDLVDKAGGVLYGNHLGYNLSEILKNGQVIVLGSGGEHGK